MGEPLRDHRHGLGLAFAAYGLWGLLPLYWLTLRPATPLEIMAHRVVWSVVFVAVLVLVLRRTAWLRTLRRRPRAAAGLAVAAVLIGVNWYTYIYGVNSGHVVETSLGYFVNPLVAVLLGVLVLRERLRPTQWAAVGLGTVAVVVLTVDYGALPWISLVLAVSFGLYGLVKKVVAAPPLEGLGVESAVLAVPALAYLATLETGGQAAFGHTGTGHGLLLAGAGIVTAVPLLFFAGAANRVPLSTIAMVQYLAPTLQFLIGVLLLGEPMPAARWVGFGLVWLALAVFTADALRHVRRTRRAVRAAREEGAVSPAAVPRP